MIKIIWLIALFLPLFSIKSEENWMHLSSQAEALWTIGDYDQAGNIYEQMLEQSLSAWQHARLIYNLGTVKLSQHELFTAFELFQKINPINLSLPILGNICSLIKELLIYGPPNFLNFLLL